jgi:hypothetical protein
MIPERIAAQMLETAESCLVRGLLAASEPLDFRNLIPSMRSMQKRLGKKPPHALSAVLMLRFGAKIPDDQELEKALLRRNAYSLNPRTRAALFDRLENGTNVGERIHVFEGLAGKQLSTEHIMPQGLSDAWRTALGADANRVHRTYLNTLCNLTVSGYNNVYSNRPFKEKRDGFVTPDGDAIPGFRDSPYRLTRYVASCKAWTEREMLERNRLLSQRISRVFPMPWTAEKSAPSPTAEKPREVQPAPAPVTTHPPTAPARAHVSPPAVIKGKRMDLMPLEEDGDRTIVSRKMLGYQYKGMSYPAKHWVTMFTGLLGLLLNENKDKAIAAIGSGVCPQILALQHRNGMKILNKKLGIWYASNASILEKLAAMRSLFKALGIRLDECGIYLNAVAGRPATAVQYPQVPKSDRSGKPTLLVEDAVYLVKNGRRDKARNSVPAPSPASATQNKQEAKTELQKKAVSSGKTAAPAESNPSSRMITIVPDASETWKELAVNVGRCRLSLESSAFRQGRMSNVQSVSFRREISASPLVCQTQETRSVES